MIKKLYFYFVNTLIGIGLILTFLFIWYSVSPDWISRNIISRLVSHDTKVFIRKNFIEKCLEGRSGPIIAASDYIRSHVDQIRPYIHSSFTTLGTDGYGRSDTRKELRKFFEVNKESIVVNTLSTLSKEQKIASKIVKDAIEKYNIDPEKPYPTKL